MDTLKVGFSGIRGVPGRSLSPDIAQRFSAAFAALLNNTGSVVVARDTRPAGEIIKLAVLSALSACGMEAIDAEILPAPVVQKMISKLGAAGAILISATHNRPDWCAIKFVGPDGAFLDAFQMEELIDIYNLEDFHLAQWKQIKRIKKIDSQSLMMDYLKSLEDIFSVDSIASAGYRILFDLCNGAASLLMPFLAGRFGLEASYINADSSGKFVRIPDPVPQNVGKLISLMKIGNFDLGVAFDSDCDRVAFFTASGQPAGEDYTLVMVEDAVLKRSKGLIVTNLSTSKAVDDVAEQHGVNVLRTKVGQAYVYQSMISRKAVVAGEGNGAVAQAEVGPFPDGFASLLKILEYMSQNKISLDDWLSSLPKYYIVKKKVSLEGSKTYVVMNELRCVFKYAKDVDLTDGLKVFFEDAWVHIRPSQTEPSIRVIAEASSLERAKELTDSAIKFIEAVKEG